MLLWGSVGRTFDNTLFDNLLSRWDVDYRQSEHNSDGSKSTSLPGYSEQFPLVVQPAVPGLDALLSSPNTVQRVPSF